MNTRLTQIAHHVFSQKPRVVVSRSLGSDVMPLLTGRADIEVCFNLQSTFFMVKRHRLTYGRMMTHVTANGSWNTLKARLVSS